MGCGVTQTPAHNDMTGAREPARFDVTLQGLTLESYRPVDAGRVRSALERELARHVQRLPLQSLSVDRRENGRLLTLTPSQYSSPERLGRALAELIIRQVAP